MKAKMFTKKAFSLMFCLTVALFMCCMSFSAFAAETDCTHEVLDAWEQLTPSTCTQTGIKVRRCVDCNEIVKTEVIPCHNYTVLYGTEPTCMKTGYQFKMCVDCYDMITETLEIDETAHNYSDWVITTEATCIKDSGVRTKTCLNTDENGVRCTSEVIENFSDKDNHVNITWNEADKKPATCEESGFTPGVCNDCGQQVSKIHPRHSDTEPVETTIITEPTCHTEGVKRCLCACGLEYEVAIEVDESAHVYGEWYIEKEAGCTSGKRVRYCIYHPSVSESQIIPATGSEHTYGEWEVIDEPDCTTTGLRVKKCTGCGVEVEEVMPVHHVYATWTTTKEMSCEEGNLKTGEKVAECAYCNYTKKFAVPAIHSFGDWYVKEKADCKTGNPGLKQRICSNCDKVEVMTYYDEHDFSLWVATVDPVCADEAAGDTGRPGVYTRWCKTCKTAEEKPIPVTHEYERTEILEYPTCTESGREVVACKFCGKETTCTIPALDHKYSEWEIVTEASCNAEGKRMKTCAVCKDKIEETVAPSHSYIWILEGEYVCESGKQTNIKICSKCGVQSTASAITLSAGYHPNLRTEVIEATCTTSGYTIDYCPDCGYSTVYDIKTAKGHTLSAKWYDMLEPSCTSRGLRYKTCADCDYIELVEIESTKHSLIVITPGVEPTCTQPGYTSESYCAECKQIFPSVNLPMEPHVFENGACVNCRVYQGTEDGDGHGGCVCSCHSSDSFDAIIFGIIKKLYQLFGINQVCACGELHYEEVGFFGKLLGRG